MPKEKILVSAYSCEPKRGSEPGVGWSFIEEMSKYYYLIVLTRDDKRHILDKTGIPNVEFKYVGIPGLKKSARFGIMAFVHYYLWQVYLLFYVIRNINLDEIKLIHHVTFVNSWTPSFLSLLNVKFIWGPIGEHSRIPRAYLSKLPRRYMHKDTARYFTRRFFQIVDPFYRLTKRRAAKIFVINEAMRPHYNESKTIVLPAISLDSSFASVFENPRGDRGIFNVYWAGNVVYWKGIDILVDAFLDFSVGKSDVHLTVIGEGVDLNRIKKRASHSSNIQFINALPQDDLFTLIRDMDVFFYPSFEGGGMILLESMALGKPAIGFDFGGPGEMIIEAVTGYKIEVGEYQKCVTEFVDRLNRYYYNQELLEEHGLNAAKEVNRRYSGSSKILRMIQHY